ncbi:MAG: hypothetical protein U0572_07195 [Phycisphaerales bacterium]
MGDRASNLKMHAALFDEIAVWTENRLRTPHDLSVVLARSSGRRRRAPRIEKVEQFRLATVMRIVRLAAGEAVREACAEHLDQLERAAADARQKKWLSRHLARASRWVPELPVGPHPGLRDEPAYTNSPITRTVVVRIDSYEGEDTRVFCGDFFEQDYLYCIVVVHEDGSAGIVDTGYRSYTEAIDAWPDAAVKSS